MVKANEISASLEDYIEAIYVISHENRVARVTDISERLDVRKSSVTGALKTLSSLDIINHDPYSFITLTEKGEEIGKEIFRRHTILKRFLTNILGVKPEKAEASACGLEHALDSKILEKIVTFIEFIESCPRIGTEWLRNHVKICKVNKPDSRCELCIKTCLQEFNKKK
jgi:DtxR family Mn-dependent transcriptional regulator